MPYIKQKEYEKLIETQKTTSGITTFSGSISNELDTLDYSKLLEDYATIRNSDSVATATLDILKLPIIFADWEIVLDEYSDTDQGKAIQEYLYYTFDNLYDSWSGFIKHALLKFDFGSSWFEKVWLRGYDYQGKKTNLLTRLYPFQNQAIYQFKYNDHMDLEGIIFEKILPNGRKGGYIPISKDDLFYLVNDMEYNDVRGRSILRTARIPCEMKRRIMLADARTAERGAGIIKGTVFGNMSDAQKGQFQTTLSTLSNSQSGFIVEQKDKFEVNIMPLDGQQNNIERMKYYDSLSFYNTLTQFMSSGISTAYGSRSTAEILQTPYELKVTGTMKEIESAINELCFEIVNNSFFGAVSKQDMPVFKFSTPKNQDLKTVAQNIVSLASARGLNFRPEDEVFFRKAFGMPEFTIDDIQAETEGKADTSFSASAALYVPLIQQGIITPEEMRNLLKLPEIKNFKPLPQVQTVQTESSQQPELSIKCNHKTELAETKSPYSEICERVFELQSAVETFQIIDEAAENVVNNIYDRLVREWAAQLDENPKRKPADRFKGELISKLTALYNKARQQGVVDVKKEINKLVKTEQVEAVELASENIKNVNTDKRMGMKITKLYETLSNQIQEDLANQTKDSIDNQGGIERYIIDKYKDANKQNRDDLKTFTGNGYTSGRLEEIAKSGKYVELFEYVGKLDKNICDECAPFDGMQMSLDDWTAAGMNTNVGEQNLNPNCKGMLGANKCRCQLVPVKLLDYKEAEKQSQITPAENKTIQQTTIQDQANNAGLDFTNQKRFLKETNPDAFLLLLAAEIYSRYAGTGSIIETGLGYVKELIKSDRLLGMINGKETNNAVITYGPNGYFVEPVKE